MTEKLYESYDFLGHRFDVTKALELIEEKKIKFSLVNLDNAKQWAKSILGADKYECIDGEYQRTDNKVSAIRFDPNAAMNLPEEACKKPLLLIRYNKTEHMLIDGHHRLFKSYIENTIPKAIIISDPKAIDLFYSHANGMISLVKGLPRKRKVDYSQPKQNIVR